MKKTCLNLRGVPIRASVNLLCVISLVLFFTFGLSMSASAAQDKTVTFKVEKASLESVINIIRAKTGVKFFYSVDKISGITNITMNVVNAPVSDVVAKLLERTSLTFTYVDDVIVIKDKPETSKSVVVITGRVISRSDGTPVAGAHVYVKGSLFGVPTDTKGDYTLKCAKTPESIMFSFMGMKTREVEYTGKNVINVSLDDDGQTMGDVVVTGYQTIKKREMTSSIYTLKSEEIIEPTYNTLDKMLQGKVPGMAVMNQSSTVGAAPKIRIRGSSSILGNREPVWVLDGIILEDPVKLDVTELNSMDKVNLIGNAISGINPEDIDRIDVLKDASATAIYGVKAANGVIMITTKRGKMGPPSITYSTSMSLIQRPTTEMMKVMNSMERVEASQEMHMRGLQFVGQAPVGSVGYEGLLSQLWEGKISRNSFDSGVQSLKEMNTDWYKLLFRNSFSNSHTLSVSGATDRVGYYFSAGYSSQKGTSLQEQNNRYNFMSNLDFKISPKLRATVSMMGAISNGTRQHSSIDLYSYAYQTSRALPVYNEDGSLYYYDRATGIAGSPNLKYNILNELQNSGTLSKDNSLNTNINLDYKIMKELSFNTVVSYNTGTNKQESWVSDRSYYASALRRTAYGYELLNSDNIATFKKDSQLPFGGLNDSQYTQSSTYTGRASLNFNKMIGEDHSLSAVAGMEIRGVHYEGSNMMVYGYLPDRGKQVAIVDPTVYTGFGRYSSYSQPRFTDNLTNNMSYYGVLSYGYKNRYIFSANVRGDASNRLGQDKSARFLPIWSVSGRWNITNEDFLLNRASWLDELSVRGSFGIQGNVTDAHNPNMIINLGTLDAQSEQYISTLASLPNPGLLWERTQSYNVGLDVSLFKGRLAFTAEYYAKYGKDQLLSAMLASTSGTTSATTNAGTMENKGWELSLNATLIKQRDWTWSMSFNTSRNYNKVTNSGYESAEVYSSYISGSLIRNGTAVNSFYSYRYAGLDQYGMPSFDGIKAKDADGNIIINSREEAFAKAFVYSGNREPNFTGGLSTFLKYKNLSMNATFSFALGVDVRLNNLYLRDDQRLPYPEENMQREFVNRWRKPGDEKFTNIPTLSDVSPSLSSYGAFLESGTTVIGSNIWQMYNYSTLRVVPGDFFRCRNISFGYSFSKELLKSTPIKGITINVGMSNPFVIKSKQLEGRDPEQSTLGSGSIPPQSTYTFSLSATF